MCFDLHSWYRWTSVQYPLLFVNYLLSCNDLDPSLSFLNCYDLGPSLSMLNFYDLDLCPSVIKIAFILHFSWYRIKICFHIRNSYNVRNFLNKCVIDSLSNSPDNSHFLQLANLFLLNVPILRQCSLTPLLAGGLFTHSLTRQGQIAMNKVFIKKCHEEKSQW